MIDAVGDEAIEPQRKQARGLGIVIHGVGELTQSSGPRRRYRRWRPGILLGHDGDATQALRGVDRVRRKALEQQTAGQGRRSHGGGLEGYGVEGGEQRWQGSAPSARGLLGHHRTGTPLVARRRLELEIQRAIMARAEVQHLGQGRHGFAGKHGRMPPARVESTKFCPGPCKCITHSVGRALEAVVMQEKRLPVSAQTHIALEHAIPVRMPEREGG